MVSPRAIPCPIDHSSIMDPYSPLVYIPPPQFPMITSVLPNDPTITPPTRDRSGSISHLPTNSRSSKTNRGIKAVIHNKVGDLRSGEGGGGKIGLNIPEIPNFDDGPAGNDGIGELASQ